MGDNATNKPNNRISVPQLLDKLNKLYDKEESIIKQGRLLKYQYDQLQEDKELLETMIMHKSNKLARFNNARK